MQWNFRIFGILFLEILFSKIDKRVISLVVKLVVKSVIGTFLFLESLRQLNRLVH